jgi:UDP-2,3-diacylglucosamine pyrophosphatase LpxH
MLKLIFSDIHISAGTPPGEFNPYEDFHYDSVMAEFLAYYSTGQNHDRPVELIINGDFLDPLKVPINQTFPDKITNAIALRKVSICLDGHPIVVKALRDFVSRPDKSITYIMGNHDMEIAYPSVQQLFRSVIGGPTYQDRIRFRIFEPFYDLPGGVRVCHGQQFEALNRVNLERLFLTQGYAEPILNLPWGSIFLLKVIMPMKAERPYINLVHPFARYLSMAMITDTSWAAPAWGKVVYYFLKTRFLEARKRAVSFTHTLDILREEAAFTPNLENAAIQMLDDNPTLTAIIMGHTHGAKVRRYKKRGAMYINTGTWTKLISLDLPDLGVHTRFTYALVEYPQTGPLEPPKVSLQRWFGTQQPFIELRY